MTSARLVVGISGASGAIYGIRLLELLRTHHSAIETHLILTRAAVLTLQHEADRSIESVKMLASVTHPIGDIGACIASGSYRTLGMIVAPCSMRSLAAIATGTGDTLLARAADVTLKERRPLVLLARETPLHLGHLRAMVAVTEMGAIVAPPVPAFYAKPASLEAMVDHTVARVLDLLGLPLPGLRRWGEMPASAF